MSENEKKLNELYVQESDLKSRIAAETHLPTKRNLMEQKAKLSQKIQTVQTAHDSEKDKEAETELRQLLKENRLFIYVNANGSKLKISEDLEIEIQYEPCRHKLQMPLLELLRNELHPSNRTLLTQWQMLLRQDITTTMTLNCRKCHTEKESQTQNRFWIHGKTDKPLGRCQIVLRRLQ